MTDQPEHRLSHFVEQLFERVILEPCWFTAIDRAAKPMGSNDGERRTKHINWENARRFRGIKPAHLDWYLYGCTSRVYTQFELKYGKPEPNTGQETTIRLLTQRGIPTGTFNTVMDVFCHVRDAGLQLHGNAENIAIETEMRWRAADEKVRGGDVVKKPRKIGKAREAKPTASRLRKVAALRATGLRF